MAGHVIVPGASGRVRRRAPSGTGGSLGLDERRTGSVSISMSWGELSATARTLVSWLFAHQTREQPDHEPGSGSHGERHR